MANELVKYDAACTAIASAYKVDEVKNIRDKHMAVALYAKQAKNKELERQATEIRVRAERRAGQLLAEMPKAKGAREPGTKRGATRSNDTTASETLEKLGITKDQSSKWQKFAKMPETDFERALMNSVDGIASGRRIISVGLHNAKIAQQNKLREAGEPVPTLSTVARLPRLLEHGPLATLYELANKLHSALNFYSDNLNFEGSCTELGEHREFVCGLHGDILKALELAEKIREYANKFAVLAKRKDAA
jgi:hypothetical protein